MNLIADKVATSVNAKIKHNYKLRENRHLFFFHITRMYYFDMVEAVRGG
jgi:hypothetical protein